MIEWIICVAVAVGLYRAWPVRVFSQAKTADGRRPWYRPGHIFHVEGHIYIITRLARGIDQDKSTDGFYVRELAFAPDSFEFFAANNDPQFTDS